MKAKKKTAPMTQERLANAIAKDFEATNGNIATMREEMATKKDIDKVREEMENLRGDLGIRISTAKDELQEQIAGLRYAKEIDELRARVNRLEDKLGMSRRAA